MRNGSLMALSGWWGLGRASDTLTEEVGYSEWVVPPKIILKGTCLYICDEKLAHYSFNKLLKLQVTFLGPSYCPTLQLLSSHLSRLYMLEKLQLLKKNLNRSSDTQNPDQNTNDELTPC
jgi:hypothetical protein